MNLKHMFRKWRKPNKNDGFKSGPIEIAFDTYLPDNAVSMALAYVVYKEVKIVEFDPSNPTGVPTSVLNDLYK